MGSEWLHGNMVMFGAADDLAHMTCLPAIPVPGAKINHLVSSGHIPW